MNDQDYIRKAVELADGWDYSIEDEGTEYEFIYLEMADGTYWAIDEEHIDLRSLPRIFKDALAAQLVRQVDALDDLIPLAIHSYESMITKPDSYTLVCDEGRTMNTIRVIVDSEVLA